MFNKHKLLVHSHNIATTCLYVFILCSAGALDPVPWDIIGAKHYSYLIRTQIIRMVMMVLMRDE